MREVTRRQDPSLGAASWRSPAAEAVIFPLLGQAPSGGADRGEAGNSAEQKSSK